MNVQTYTDLLMMWDEAYRAIKGGKEDYPKARVKQINDAVQRELDRGRISQNDALHFAALVCYLKPNDKTEAESGST